ncbi:unnamed protein product [Cylindrotheca closterium]|uniref:Uncharacterized protein n=1 Tax=Cylindrotheca closterium TaxID=2856 RepID=A0AAD2CLQ6_9STRA|nr:unnamed protein product [Cylindrotheca closterium]
MFPVRENKKRPRETAENGEGPSATLSEICSFCRGSPTALQVLVPVRHRKKRVPASYCVFCYYTTSVVRLDADKFVAVYDQSQLDEQLPSVQKIFGEVFVEIRKELEVESERAFQKQKADPLAMLHRAPNRKLKAPPMGPDKKAGKKADGGFLRDIPIPERLLQTQQRQAELQRAQTERMNRVASQNDESVSLFQRRKASKKSIWNLAMETSKQASTKPISSINEMAIEASATCSSCGSTNIRSFGNITSRNQDMRKGETWGMKDRGGEVVSKYQCNSCGKTWHEED